MQIGARDVARGIEGELQPLRVNAERTPLGAQIVDGLVTCIRMLARRGRTKQRVHLRPRASSEQVPREEVINDTRTVRRASWRLRQTRPLRCAELGVTATDIREQLPP